jgi:hypothetical protein
MLPVDETRNEAPAPAAQQACGLTARPQISFALTFHLADGSTETRQFTGRVEALPRDDDEPTKQETEK